jgi:hypothetical protein
MNELLFVAVLFGEYGCQRAEEATRFIVGSCGKPQSGRGTGGAIIAEGQGPNTVDQYPGVVGIEDEADEFLGEAVEGGDPAAAEIADENGVAELAEVARSPDDSPGSVEPVAVLEATLECTGGAEDSDETEAGAGDGIVPGSILLSVSDEQAAADVLDIEGREAGGNSLVVEGGFVERYALKIRVVDLDLGAAEIGDVEEFLALDFTGSHSLVDRAVRRALIRVVYFQNGVWRRRLAAGDKVYGRIPAGDGAVFGGKDEDGRFTGGLALIEEEINSAAVVYDAGGSRRRPSSGETWRRDNYEVAGAAVGFDEDVLRVSVAVVQSGRTGIVIGDPPRTANRSTWLHSRGAGESPGILQVGVGLGGHPGSVGDEIRLGVLLREREVGSSECCKCNRSSQLGKTVLH